MTQILVQELFYLLRSGKPAPPKTASGVVAFFVGEQSGSHLKFFNTILDFQFLDAVEVSDY